MTTLTADFPTINPLYSKQILDNKFDPINISKLCTDVTDDKSIELKKVWKSPPDRMTQNLATLED